jgi:hypothetical protein
MGKIYDSTDVVKSCDSWACHVTKVPGDIAGFELRT